MRRPPSIICGMCQCTLDSGDCVHVYGTGTTDDPYRFEPIISSAAGNLIECGPNGLGAFLLPIYVDPPAVHAYATIEQHVPFDAPWPLKFNENRYNTDNMLDDDDQGIIRFNTPGLYLVTFNARWKKTNDNAATGDMAAFIMRNGAQYLVIDSYPVAGGDSFAKHSISILYPFEAGDWANALLKQDVVDSDDEPMILTATVHRMSPIFTAMYMRPLEGMNILGVPASEPSAGGGGTPGTQYNLNGTSQYWSTPDHASLDITSDIDIRVACAPVDWTPSATQALIGKYISSAGARSYLFQLLNTGPLRLTTSSNGTDGPDQSSTVGTSFIDGSTRAVRVTLDVDNGAGNRVANFYTKVTSAASALTDCASDSGWTQLGATVTTAPNTSIHSSTSPLGVGADNVGGTPAGFFSGDIYAMVLKDGINGTTVANPDFYHNNSPFTDGAGRTWTKT